MDEGNNIGEESDSIEQQMDSAEVSAEAKFFAKKSMEKELDDRQRDIDKNDAKNAFDNIFRDAAIGKMMDRIAQLEKQVATQNTTPPLTGEAIAPPNANDNEEACNDYYNTEYLIQVDSKSVSGSYPPVIKTLGLRTATGHKSDVTMYGSEGAWPSKTRVPTLPKDAGGAGDLTWVEQQTVTVIVDIQFDTSSGYIQVKTQDLTVLAKSAVSAWTNKIQAFPCSSETVSGQMVVNGVTTDVTVLGAANP